MIPLYYKVRFANRQLRGEHAVWQTDFTMPFHVKIVTCASMTYQTLCLSKDIQ